MAAEHRGPAGGRGGGRREDGRPQISLPEDADYIGDFLRMSNRIEKPLLRAIAVLLAALVLAQAALAFGVFRSRLSQVDRLEGSPFVVSARQPVSFAPFSIV